MAEKIVESLIFEKSVRGRKGVGLPASDVPEVDPGSVFPETLLRETPARLPEVPEFDVVRHYTRLSSLNYHIDKGLWKGGDRQSSRPGGCH